MNPTENLMYFLPWIIFIQNYTEKIIWDRMNIVPQYRNDSKA